jgi:hypothetical protein
MEVLSWPSVRDAARFLGCRQEAVYNAILRGRLHAERCALGLLIDPESLKCYAATKRTWRRGGTRVG